MAVIHVLLALIFAPLLGGLFAWCRFVASGGSLAKAPSLMGRYAALKALCAKGTAYGPEIQPYTPIAPLAVLSCLVTALFMVPLGGQPPQLHFTGDFLLLAGLLTLARLLGLLAALDGSPVYKAPGASAFCARGLLAEPLLLSVFLGLGLAAGSYSLFGMVSLAELRLWEENRLWLLLPGCALFLIALDEEFECGDCRLVEVAASPGGPLKESQAPGGKNIIGVKPGGRLAKLAAKKDELEARWNREPVAVSAKGGLDMGIRVYGDSLKLWIYAALLCSLAPHTPQNLDLALAGGVGGIFLAAIVLGLGRGLAARFPVLTPNLLFSLSGISSLVFWGLVFWMRHAA